MQKQLLDEEQLSISDLQPTEDFVDGPTRALLQDYEVLTVEFGRSLSSLSIQDEFDTALVVDNPIEIQRILTTHVEWQQKYSWQKLFAIAVEHGKSPKIVKLCIEQGADPNFIDANKETSSLVSAIRNNAMHSVCQTILDSGLHIDGFANMTHLQYAILYNKVELLRTLYNKGADINAIDTNNKRGSPLHFAISLRSVDVAIELLKIGANPNSYGSNLFHALCFPPYLDPEVENKLVDALVEYGTDLEGKDNFGRTAFLLAVQESRFLLARSLHLHGASISAVDAAGQNALLIFVKSPCALSNIELCTYLLSNGVDPNLLPVQGFWSAVGWMEKITREKIGNWSVYQDILRLFLKLKVNIDESLLVSIGEKGTPFSASNIQMPSTEIPESVLSSKVSRPTTATSKGR